MSDGAIVVAIFLESARVEIVCSRQAWINRQGFLEHLSRSSCVALLHQDAADVGPAVGILRIGFGDFLERGASGLQITLQEKADPIVIPSSPILFCAGGSGLRRWSASREDTQRLRILGDGDDGKIGNGFEIPGYFRCVAGERPFAIVIVRSSATLRLRLVLDARE